MGAREVAALRMHLAVTGRVAASAQNRAKRALLLLHREVLGRELPSLDDAVWGNAFWCLPVALTAKEVQCLSALRQGTMGLTLRLAMATLGLPPTPA